MTNEEIQERRTILLTSLKKLRNDLSLARVAHYNAYDQYKKVEEEFHKLDRLLAEQNVTKVPERKSGKLKPIKDPTAFLKTLSTEQKHKLLEELGLASPT